MPNYTKNSNLILPFQSENYDVAVANANNTAIDSELHKKVSKVNGKDLSTNDFTDEYKRKIDKLSNMFSVKGTVATVADLNNIVNAKENDAYLVSSENCIYGYTEEQGWINLGSIFNITIIENNIVQRVTEDVDSKLQTITDTVTLAKDTNIINNYEVTFSKKYQVRKQLTYCNAEPEKY